MKFSPISLGLVLLPFVSAAVHDVQVGVEGGKLLYSPEAIGAQPGDQVVFHFHAKNHTATQSSFDNPCGAKEGGFDSGFIPVPANQTDNFPTYTITINDTAPVWVYCRQGGKTPASHCGQGMVFAVNCGFDDAPNSFANFKNSALAIGAKLVADAAAAPSSDAASPANTAPAAGYTTAPYGDYTIPAAPVPTPVTQPVTLGDQVWTTTYDSYPGSPDPTPVSAEGAVHKVIVGGPGKLTFDPPFISAQPRDTVVFEFRQKNHTVTQSSFADPCRKPDNGGFDSGFMPVADSLTSDFPTWSITINDTAPIWAYCRQKTPISHCGAAMVFAINPVQNSERNFTAFQNIATAINGTAAAQSAGPEATGATKASGAVSIRTGSAGIALAVAAIFATML
jgi:plastocyanin